MGQVTFAPEDRLSNRVGTVRAAFGDLVEIALRFQSKAAPAAKTHAFLSPEVTTFLTSP